MGQIFAGTIIISIAISYIVGQAYGWLTLGIGLIAMGVLDSILTKIGR